ncbi:MAG: rRNA maturation RNase YbeY [Moraxella sp.]|nr:rRNA maturation RNase YbeY [Moraxella sp.]
MNDITVSFGDDTASLTHLVMYQDEPLTQIFNHTLAVMCDKVSGGLVLPYFAFRANFSHQDWINLPKSLDVYVCGTHEGQALNLDARGKDYATNILSYPSGLPLDVCVMMNKIPLGELVICHDVVMREADEQHKTPTHHLTHLLVHGILHLLGFDHELGQDEQDEMESFEIQILQGLGIDNPYE